MNLLSSRVTGEHLHMGRWNPNANALPCSLKVSIAHGWRSLRRAVETPAMDFQAQDEKRVWAHQGLRYYRKQRQQAAKERLQFQVWHLQNQLHAAMCMVSELQHQLVQVKSLGSAEQRAERTMVNKPLVLMSEASAQTEPHEARLLFGAASTQTEPCDMCAADVEVAFVERLDISRNDGNSTAVGQEAVVDDSLVQEQSASLAGQAGAADMGGGQPQLKCGAAKGRIHLRSGDATAGGYRSNGDCHRGLEH